MRSSPEEAPGTVPLTPRPPYTWSADETQSVLVAYLGGASIRELAVISRRSPHHVVQHLAWQLTGVTPQDVNALAPRFREPWSDNELLWLRLWWEQDLGVAEVAEGLDRDLTEVAERIILDRLVAASFLGSGLTRAAG